MNAPITLQLGQGVPWPASPTGYAQVADLRRRNVRVVYRTKRGTWRGRTLAAVELATLIQGAPLMFDLFNPFDRGVLPRSKTYTPQEVA